MERLWAPWRMKYIEKINDDGCFLCNALQAKDESSVYILEKKNNSFVIMNIFPYNSGHLMIAPSMHTGNLEDLNGATIVEMFSLINTYKSKMQKTMNPDGYNIGINIGRSAGAGVLDHIHIHIVPRWNGDTNFMPILDGTKVLPQALDETFQLLKKTSC